MLRLNWTEHFCCFSFLLTYVCHCFLFFSWRGKNKLHVLASSLWATSHLMWPLLSNTAVLPEEGGSLARKHLLWTPWTVVAHGVLRPWVLVTHQRPSVDRQLLITSGRIHLGTPRFPATKQLELCCRWRAAGFSNVKPNIWGCCKGKTELYLDVERSGACNDLKQVVPQQEVSDGQKREKIINVKYSLTWGRTCCFRSIAI